MRRLLAIAVLCAALPAVATAASPKFASLDTAEYPTVRATVVTPKPVGSAPKLTENGRPVVGFRAVNLGREKSVMLLFDRSQSMIGQAIKDASAAARQFVGSKPARDRIALVAVGKKAVQLTGFAYEPRRNGRRPAHDRGRQGPRHRALRRDPRLDAGARRRPQPDPRADPAHRRPGGLQRRQPRAGDRRSARGPRRRLRDRDREPELPAGAAAAAGREDRRPLRRRQRDEGPEEDLRRPRRGAPPHLAAELRHLGASRRPDRRRSGRRPCRVDRPRRPRRLEARRLEAAGRVLRDRPRRDRHDRRHPRPDLGPLPAACSGRLTPAAPDQPAPRRAEAQGRARAGRGAVRNRLQHHEGDREGVRPPACLARAAPAARAG